MNDKIAAQRRRAERAKKITVEEAVEVREDIWVMECVNDNGEERTISLVPLKLFSSSKDMIYRGRDGYVGKYLLALARVDLKAREQLETAIGNRLNAIQEDIQALESEFDTLAEAGQLLKESEDLSE